MGAWVCAVVWQADTQDTTIHTTSTFQVQSQRPPRKFLANRRNPRLGKAIGVTARWTGLHRNSDKATKAIKANRLKRKSKNKAKEVQVNHHPRVLLLLRWQTTMSKQTC